MAKRPVVVLTGGPGGGKSTLIEELREEPMWAGRFVALPEAIRYTWSLDVSPREKLFQRLMVCMQIALEDGLERALGSSDPRFVVCHRGSLDPLAYWWDRGWAEEEFFEFTETCREDHYARYTAVIHLVTAADGAKDHYSSWPEAHRPEAPLEATTLDRLLQRAWSDHPNYFHVDNKQKDWMTKATQAKTILSSLVARGRSG